jgi:SAM-dependent methyltransferase
MSEFSDHINHQYGQRGMVGLILSMYESAGIPSDQITLDDLSLIDQLHAGGRDGTRFLAELARITPGLNILDIGSGIGGPARTLAAEYGCRVTGIDITEEFVLTARQLTDLVGLSDRVTFRVGNALDLAFEDNSFDTVWIQNSLMNVEEKAQVFREAYRVLKSGGNLAFESIMSGGTPEARFPVFWADRPEISFMTIPEEFKSMMGEIGFRQLTWQDHTEKSAESNRKLLPVYKGQVPKIGMHIFMDGMYEKILNTLNGFEDGTYLYIYAVYRKFA